MFDMTKFLEKNFKCVRSGTNLVFNCPCCKDKSLNYWFDIAKKYVHKKNKRTFVGLGQCFRCEKRHSVLTFVMEVKKLDLKTALEFIGGADEDVSLDELAEMLSDITANSVVLGISEILQELRRGFKVPLPPGTTQELPNGLVDWFVNKRKYPKEMLKWLSVGYCYNSKHDKDLFHLRNRAIFPVSSNGSFAWQGYLYKPGVNSRTGAEFPKTRNPPGPFMKSLLFLYDYVRNDKVIIVNEGIFDSLRTLSRGFSPVALLGKRINPNQAYLLSKTKSEEVCICLDGGKKEREAALKNAKTLSDFYDNTITIMNLPDDIDPDDVSEKIFVRSYNRRVEYERPQNTELAE